MAKIVREITSEAELEELPNGSLIWYWVRWDASNIHAIMQKIDHEWLSATEVDDTIPYNPVVPCYLLDTEEE